MTRKHRHDTVAEIQRGRPARTQPAAELQHFGTIARLPIALDTAVCAASVENLNQLLADTMTLRDLYERIQSLGGVSIAMAHDVADMTLIPRPNRGREDVSVQISRLLQAHEIVLKEARAMAGRAAEAGDDGTNDLLVSDVIRTGEMQVWFLGEHLVGPGGAKSDGAGRD